MIDRAQQLRSGSSGQQSLYLYVAGVLGLGGSVLCLEMIDHGSSPWLPMPDAAFWFVLTLAAEIFWLETPTRRGMVSMSLAVNIATLFLLPAHLVLGIGGAAVLAADLLLHRRGWLKACFNAAQTVVTLFACLLVLRLLAGSGQTGGSQLLVRQPLLMVAVPVVFFTVNTLLVAGAISLQDDSPLDAAWKRNYGHAYQALSSVVLSLLGVVLVIVEERIGYLGGLLYLVFFFFVRDAYHRDVRSRRETAAASR